jgi:hypothetical protein
MGIPHPHIGMAGSPEQAMDLAETIGYPLVTAYRLTGSGIDTPSSWMPACWNRI